MTAPKIYYNEHDPEKAAWLRELCRRNLIAPGVVDERDIRDIRPDELLEFAQCHFFAGIGVWSYALRRAGWRDDHPVWTGSCPCQPFSQAGKRAGEDDERHLWPSWFHLISQCRPRHVFGEQVASSDGLAWLDLVQADLEAAGYSSGAVDLSSAGVGAPHIRQRLWFVAHPGVDGAEQHARELSRDESEHEKRPAGSRHPLVVGCPACDLAHAQGGGRGECGDALEPGTCRHAHSGEFSRRVADAENGGEERVPGLREDREEVPDAVRSGEPLALADTAGEQRGEGRLGAESDEPGPVGGSSRPCAPGGLVDAAEAGLQGGPGHAKSQGAVSSVPGPVNGFWADAVWLPCRDGKARPAEPGTFPLAHGAPFRVVRLRGYGDAINAEAAEKIVTSYKEVINA